MGCRSCRSGFLTSADSPSRFSGQPEPTEYVDSSFLSLLQIPSGEFWKYRIWQYRRRCSRPFLNGSFKIVEICNIRTILHISELNISISSEVSKMFEVFEILIIFQVPLLFAKPDRQLTNVDTAQIQRDLWKTSRTLPRFSYLLKFSNGYRESLSNNCFERIGAIVPGRDLAF